MSRSPAPHPQTVLGGECSLDRRLWERPGVQMGCLWMGPTGMGAQHPCRWFQSVKWG